MNTQKPSAYLFRIPEGATASKCPHCEGPVYRYEMRPGRTTWVDALADPRGQAPTKQNPGSGVLHRRHCPGVPKS